MFCENCGKREAEVHIEGRSGGSKELWNLSLSKECSADPTPAEEAEREVWLSQTSHDTKEELMRLLKGLDRDNSY